MDTDKKKLFENKTAWFMPNTSDRFKLLWFKNGGELETQNQAQFIFGEKFDPHIALACHSGNRTDRYPTVLFHAKYIQDVVEAGDRNKVPIGRYAIFPIELLTPLQTEFPDFRSYMEYIV